MKVFVSIAGNAESRASFRLALLGRSLSPVFADYIVDLIATHKPSKGMINFAPDVCRNADILFGPQCGQAGPPR